MMMLMIVNLVVVSILICIR